MKIRPEQAEDGAAIRDVLIVAFADHPHSRNNEHTLVDALREAHALTLGLVAEEGGEVIGYIAFSPVTVAGQTCGWYGLAPLAVRPDKQRRDVGRTLVREGLKRLAETGAAGCVLLGDPDYYSRFGFARRLGLTLPGVPPAFFLALAFEDSPPAGEVAYHPAFDSCK
ncbi:GNAT family N-acetyltransferase [Crenobacter cavernae]|uniref:N-acetyltransferase n=1 Tax=Crenobacter cavernae TaxID=2290923 RepID=A0ABY0FDE0_9NEIS|nr:N-acetyltransferase [Crenobacter cavernae]RXZ43984.1 N-acetyltransferase [Crenobacter cavernae]